MKNKCAHANVYAYKREANSVSLHIKLRNFKTEFIAVTLSRQTV